MITLKRFNGALVTPKDDAILFDHLVDDSGILEGISVSHLGANQLLVSAGRGIIKGRDFIVEEETILVQISPSGVQKGRLLVRVDISNMETPIGLVTQVATTLPALVQEDINRDGTIYELPIATYDVSELLISNLVFVGKMLQPHAGNSAIHVTAGDKTNWNNKAAGNHTHTPEQVGASPSNHSHNLLTYTVTHSKSGTVHTLTGLPTAAGIYIAQFKAVANFDAGNTFAGGYTAKPMGEETALPDKAFITGDLVSVVVDVSGKKLGFRLGGASTPKFPTYTGSHAIFGTEKQGYVELYSSGTLTPQSNITVEAFLVGGGASALSIGAKYTQDASGGGGGGYTKLVTGLFLGKGTTYPVSIGSGGVAPAAAEGTVAGNAGGNTTAFSQTALGGKIAASYNRGGDGGSGGGMGGRFNGGGTGGNGGVNGGNGGMLSYSSYEYYGIGQGTPTTFNGKTYSGGGGGGTAGVGYNGAGSGGPYIRNDGLPAQPNTGGGGGGAAYDNYSTTVARKGGDGGSGIVIIRWGY